VASHTERGSLAGRARRALVWCVAFLSVLLANASARAASAEPIALDYAAAPQCPTAHDFQREVRARTSAVRFVERNPSRTLRIRIERRGDAYAGTLEVTSRSAPAAHREIEGVHCDSVALVLAIAAALAIDPAANANPVALRAPPPPAPHKTLRPPARETLVLAPAAARPVARARPRSGSRSSVDAAATLSATFGPAPVALIAPATFVEYETRGPTLWQPSIGAEPVIARTGVIGADFAAAVFTWYALRATGCPFRFGEELAFRPCAVVEAGLLHARGRAIAVPRQRTLPWLSLGAEARLTWQLLPPVFVRIAARAELIVTRHDYVFRIPRRTIYHTPLLSPAVEGGFGVRFF
jgi:hypothetical protein